jgi:hypothetical protein
MTTWIDDNNNFPDKHPVSSTGKAEKNLLWLFKKERGAFCLALCLLENRLFLFNPPNRERKKERKKACSTPYLSCLNASRRFCCKIFYQKKIDRGRKTILQPIFCRIQLNEEENEKCSFQIMIWNITNGREKYKFLNYFIKQFNTVFDWLNLLTYFFRGHSNNTWHFFRTF